MLGGWASLATRGRQHAADDTGNSKGLNLEHLTASHQSLAAVTHTDRVQQVAVACIAVGLLCYCTLCIRTDRQHIHARRFSIGLVSGFAVGCWEAFVRCYSDLHCQGLQLLWLLQVVDWAVEPQHGHGCAAASGLQCAAGSCIHTRRARCWWWC